LRQVVRGLALALVVTLTGAPAASALCGWACAEHADAVAAAGCHEHGSTPSGAGLTSVHVCDHDAAVRPFVPETPHKAPSAPSLMVFLPSSTTTMVARPMSHPIWLGTGSSGGVSPPSRSTVLRL
jgi:hypothetical protein